MIEQVGDGSTVNRLTPVNVSGLSSGAVSVVLGAVRVLLSDSSFLFGV